MTDNFDAWLFIALFIGGTVVAIIVFMRITPREFWFRHPPLAFKLKQFPESAHAVLIKGNKKRAFIYNLPLFFGVAIVFGVSMWAKHLPHLECKSIFGYNAAHVLLLLLFYGVPLFLLACTPSVTVTGFKVIRFGYEPPLDSVLFHDTIATKGFRSTLKGIACLVFPAFALLTGYYGHNFYLDIKQGKWFHERVTILEKKCK